MPEHISLASALECSLFHDPRCFEGLFEQVFGKKPVPPPPPPTEEQKELAQVLLEEIFKAHHPGRTKSPDYIFWK